MDNPYKQGTKIYQDYKILSDKEWHCTKCELISAQAKTYQKMRIDGANFYQNPETNFYSEMRYCNKCETKTSHRKFI